MSCEEVPELAQMSVRAFLNAKLSAAEENGRIRQELERLNYAARLRRIAPDLCPVANRKRRHVRDQLGFAKPL